MSEAIRSSLAEFIDNELPQSVESRPVFAGIFGDKPSLYAKSPLLWNAAFRELDMDAEFVSFDVTADNLPSLVDAVRAIPSYVGGSVTAPYKVAIMQYLDEIDPPAQHIGAVNTIARRPDGGLVGYNTDARGALDSLITTLPGHDSPFLDGLSGKRILLIGAGGAARATAFALAEAITSEGRIIITNRTQAAAEELSKAVAFVFGNAVAVGEAVATSAIDEIDIVVNASLRGQAGTRSANGQVTCLEPYSSLAQADPVWVVDDKYPDEAEFYRAWFEESQGDIGKNLSRSAEVMRRARADTAFFDLIYAPAETPMLRQARLSGHATLNGKGMNIGQAVDGFVNRTMSSFFEDRGEQPAAVYSKVFEAMAKIW